MKNKLIILYSLLAVLLSSCKDYLDRQPLSSYSESSLFTGEADALAALSGCYSYMEDGTWIHYIDCGSDNSFDPYPWEGYMELGNMMLLTPTNPGNGKWYFGAVFRCNWFLENIEKSPINENLKNRMKAEARFIRAYQYFQKSQLYGSVPLMTKPITTAEANTISRTPKTEVVQFVLTELADIVSDLPNSYEGGDVGRVTKGAALALKARVELFNQKYEDAITSTQSIMDLNVYSLFPSYQDLFRIQNEYNSEIILDQAYLENTVSLWSLGIMTPHIGRNGWYSVDPTQSLVDAYETINGMTIDDPASGYDPEKPWENRDPRLKATILVPGESYEGIIFNPLENVSEDYWASYNYTGYCIKKYTPFLSDFNDIWNSGLNIPLIRYAEVLLTYAEAKIESDQIDISVYDAIDEVRLRAGLPAVDKTKYSTQQQMRELVRRERRVELAMEGLRFYDIQRWQIGEEVLTGPVYGSRLGTVDMVTGEVVFNTPDHILNEQRVFDPSKNYLWPIPQREIDINPNLGQNPNY
jgi:starch-binding outer membrane protein, SusD/RagB family